MVNFEVIIGIEVHAVLNTKTKMFSSSPSDHNSIANTNINEIDLGLPGIMPQPNKEAVYKSIWLANELHMNINYHNIQFDRKNYFYIDLPKGYQITQQYYPIGSNGYIEINDNGVKKKILINRIHMEEDTAKQFSKNNQIFLDYNRCGMPLIEIVSEPVINSSHQAGLYLKELIKILKFANVSDAKLEDGSLRADINISIRPYGQKEFNNKVEIKNINSVNNVIKAIDFEIKRQTELILTDKIISQETRRFDDQINQTIHMRDKQDAINYRYIHEPNILAIHLSDSEYQHILSLKNPSLDQVFQMLEADGLDNSDINQLINDYDFYVVYNQLKKIIKTPKLGFKWLGIELIGLLKKDNKSYIDITQDLINRVGDLLNLLESQEINGKQAKIILENIYKYNKSAQEVIIEYGFEQIKDPNIIEEILLKHMNNNLSMVEQCFSRPERGEKFFIGLLMKDTNGQANPNISNQILKKILNNWKK